MTIFSDIATQYLILNDQIAHRKPNAGHENKGEKVGGYGVS